MKKVGFFVLGAFIGGVLAGIGVLLSTPKAGVEFRKEINEKINTLVSEVKQASMDRQEELKDELESLRLGKNIKLESSK